MVNDARLDFLSTRAQRYEPSEAFVERVQARLGEDVFRIRMVGLRFATRRYAPGW